ncbi:MAG: primosomal protein [Pyramidobacter sp.]|nr:primosomal protein [Pyramidobacter sp.]
MPAPMFYVNVIFPGPWWNALTYASECPIAAGIRVQAPVGRGTRTGVCIGTAEASSAELRLRNISKVLDSRPVLSKAYLSAVSIVSRAFLCSEGDLLRSLLPSCFWKDVPFPEYAEEIGTAPQQEFVYQYQDKLRHDVYRQKICESGGGVLCLFPEREQACAFYASLSGVIPEERLILWPASGAASAHACWKRALEQANPVIIGAKGAACAPLASAKLIIVDDESNLSWRTIAPPEFSVRSFAAARARESGAQLILGGRIPSSRVVKNCAPRAPKMPKERGRLRFIDLNRVPRVNFKGIQFPLPVSDAVLSETAAAVQSGQIVFWLLDRRGVTSEIRCAECGSAVQCVRCGTPMAFESGALRCPMCGKRAPLPDVCPQCGGRILQGALPGLESVLPMAQTLLPGKPAVLWHLDNPRTKAEAKKRLAELSSGGLLLGSRRALSLLDTLSPQLICWLDADSEARQPNYDSRFSAFSMMLESLWRGEARRQVVMQTRTPAKKWQKGLCAGWEYFWQLELAERKSLNFPPESHIVEIEFPKANGDMDSLAMKLDEAGFVTMMPNCGGSMLIVQTPRVAPLRRVLSDLFSIRRSRFGFPRVRVRSD